MKKIVVYIPARMGSQRVPKKNVRLINGKPLIAWPIIAAKESGVFDEIYLNTDGTMLKPLAEDYGIKFYQRNEYLASAAAINDEWTLDFIQQVKADIVVQLLATSPLITPAEIKDFVQTMVNNKYDTLVSVVNHQIACLHQGKGINFTPMEKHKSSQNMIPVQSYASVLMAWDTKKYLEHHQKYGFAYHGADGKTGYYVIKGLSTIDIDHEEDFNLAEVAMAFRANTQHREPHYYEPTIKTQST